MYKFALYSFYKNIGRYLIKETVKQSYLVVLKKTATTNNWVFISFSIISCLCWLSTRDTRIKGDISFVNENHLKCFSFLKSVCQNYKKTNFFCFKVFIFICSIVQKWRACKFYFLQIRLYIVLQICETKTNIVRSECFLRLFLK
jgi:hypothetical protein